MVILSKTVKYIHELIFALKLFIMKFNGLSNIHSFKFAFGCLFSHHVAFKTYNLIGRKWKRISIETEHQQHGKFSLVYEKNILITMIALVFAILKHSLQWGESYLDFCPVSELLLVNSAARRFFFVNGRRCRRKFVIQLSLFADAFIDHIW